MNYLTFNRPVKAAQYCHLHKCKQEHKQQITQGDHCYKDNHDHRIIFGILQFHPAN